MTYRCIERLNRLAYKPLKGRYSTVEKLGRIKKNSVSLLSLLRDTVKVVTSKSAYKRLLLQKRLLFWNKPAHTDTSVQVGESYVLDGIRYRLSTHNKKFKVSQTTESYYYTYVKSLVKLSSGLQITLGNGHTRLITSNQVRLHDAMRVCENGREIQWINTVSEVIKMNGPNVLSKVISTQRTAHGTVLTLVLENGIRLVLNKINLSEYIMGPSEQVKRALLL